jgi:hypothetical protein
MRARFEKEMGIFGNMTEFDFLRWMELEEQIVGSLGVARIFAEELRTE